MLTPSKTNLFIFSKVGQHSAPTKVEPRSLPECVQGLRQAQATDTLVNETAEEVVYLEVGDRTPGDEGSYPDDDLKALLVGGKWKFVHGDGTLYEVGAKHLITR